ncbi:hypothetical protein NLG97_g1116 [Lecanicillium saksenae]|uniref:Uncharacterized protein n=1 Tax=Lecanicillium saksenae TaxID=468837 RepID=A0ACC1R5A1_9HYPO|nr:hypothetical protein NLG97_g1116 [Lecanicillium saksenae]
MASYHSPAAQQPGLPAYEPYNPEMNQSTLTENPRREEKYPGEPHEVPQNGQQQQPQQQQQHYPPPPQQPQLQSTAPLPPGWIAQWSQPHNTCGSCLLLFRLQTIPLLRNNLHHMPAPPAAAHPTDNTPNDQQQYTYNQNMPPQHGMQGGIPGPDGERGLGKVLMVGGAGLLAAASFKPLKSKFDKYFGNKPHHSQQSGYYQPQPQPQYGSGALPTASSYGGGAGVYGQPTYGGVPPPMSGNVNPSVVDGGRTVPPLYIHAATYADKDVTHVVRTMIGHDQSIELKGSNLKNQFGDPWPAVDRKALIIIYQYGDRPWELLAMDNEDGISEIKPGPISKKRMDFCQPPPARILCVIWGLENATPAAHSQQLDTLGEMEASFDGLGEGGFYSWQNRTLFTMKAYIGIKFYPTHENRDIIDLLSRAVESARYETVSMQRDVEAYGETTFGPAELMRRTCEIIDACDLVVIELSEKGVGLGIEAGYAHGKGIPVVAVAREGREISTTMEGIARATKVICVDGVPRTRRIQSLAQQPEQPEQHVQHVQPVWTGIESRIQH